MKQLTLRLAPLLTIISMFLVTKWWFALPVDGPEKLYWGFPFPFLGQGFHTSMSFQFFILEFMADFAICFLGWTCLLYILSKTVSISTSSSLLLKASWSVAIILSMGFVGLLSISNPVFRIKRDYEWKILETGYVFIWQETPWPDRQE